MIVQLLPGFPIMSRYYSMPYFNTGTDSIIPQYTDIQLKYRQLYVYITQRNRLYLVLFSIFSRLIPSFRAPATLKHTVAAKISHNVRNNINNI